MLELIEGLKDKTNTLFRLHQKSYQLQAFRTVNDWFLLLDGEYIVELNGTKQKITLTKGEAKLVDTASLTGQST